jgi:hypothetical protein
MRKILVLLLMVVWSTKGEAQTVMVIEAPALEAQHGLKAIIQKVMLGSQQQMQAMQKRMDQVMKYAGWMKSMAGAKQVIELMGKTMCMTADLQVNLDLYGNFDICGNSFDFESGMMKLQSAVDYLNTIISNGQKLTTGERLNGFKSSVDLFSEAMISLYELNQNLVRQNHRANELEINLNTAADMWTINPRR